MDAPVFEVKFPGLLTTVQDLGRFGWGRDGVSEGGVMDFWSASAANLLVGNPRTSAVLEITLTGPILHVQSRAMLALVGADFTPVLDGVALPHAHTFVVEKGQTLHFGRRQTGARAYLAVAGGWSVPDVLGSRSTDLRGQFGGLSGRRLRSGDLLSAPEMPLVRGRGLRSIDLVPFVDPAPLRLILGPHDNFFEVAALETFLSCPYLVTVQSDRMGYRLDGPPIVPRPGCAAILPSEVVTMGTVQIPPSGQPLLLMADRQTVGGYPILGVVIRADLPRAAQCAPGNSVCFSCVSITEAHAALHAQERFLRLLECGTSNKPSDS